MTSEDIRAALAEAQDLFESLNKHRNDVDAELSRLNEKRSLLMRLLSIEEANANLSVGGAGEVTAEASFSDEVVAVLFEAKRPLHIGQIRLALLNRGVRIPGKGADANIISRISRDQRIERVAGRRGVYRLTSPK